ncbi:hypothetical protein WA026_008943 [Henosepilachna vigintioctopunctata]|uniref:Uncharacterized protein n=1 Tax=Henosepilachna vigintioctopunctata TaxID=420089 RepID=A0AAW1VAU3_9CUCU
MVRSAQWLILLTSINGGLTVLYDGTQVLDTASGTTCELGMATKNMKFGKAHRYVVRTMKLKEREDADIQEGREGSRRNLAKVLAGERCIEKRDVEQVKALSLSSRGQHHEPYTIPVRERNRRDVVSDWCSCVQDKQTCCFSYIIDKKG